MEFFNILPKPEFEKWCRTWYPVVVAHLNFNYTGLTVDEGFEEQWFREEMRRKRTKAMEDLQNGEYENRVVYTLSTDR